MILQETYTLANGIAIPKLGLGTWFIDNNKAAQAVRDGGRSWATGSSIRLRPTATSSGVGRGHPHLRPEAGRSCSWPVRWRRSTRPMRTPRRSIDETLEKMGLDVSGPDAHPLSPAVERVPGRKAVFSRRTGPSGVRWRMLRQRERCEVIGVSNFLRDDLENLLTGCRVTSGSEPAAAAHRRYGPALAGLLHRSRTSGWRPIPPSPTARP